MPTLYDGDSVTLEDRSPHWKLQRALEAGFGALSLPVLKYGPCAPSGWERMVLEVGSGPPGPLSRLSFRGLMETLPQERTALLVLEDRPRA